MKWIFSLAIILHLGSAWAGPSVVFRPDFNPYTAKNGSPEDILSKRIEACGINSQSVGGVLYYVVDLTLLECSGLVTEEGNQAQAIKDAGTKVVEELNAKYSHESLERLATEIKQVKILISPFGTFESIEVPGLTRRFALSLPGMKTVIFNQNNLDWILKYEFGPYLVLHEFFGTLGYPDIDYSSTLKMWRLNESKETPQDTNQWLRTLEPSSNPSMDSLNNSTGTIVGHGGDIIQMWFKMHLLSLAPIAIEIYKTIPEHIGKKVSLNDVENAISSAMIVTLKDEEIKSAGICQSALCAKTEYSELMQTYLMGISQSWHQQFTIGDYSNMLFYLALDMVDTVQKRTE